MRFNMAGQQEAVFRDAAPGNRPLEQPTDVAVTPDGTVYVVDLLGRVARINKDGLVDREWTVSVGLQRGGSHIAVWGDLLAITNPDNNTISFLDTATGVLRLPHLENGARLNLNIPIGVAAMPDGRLMILNSGNNSLTVLEKAP